MLNTDLSAITHGGKEHNVEDSEPPMTQEAIPPPHRGDTPDPPPEIPSQTPSPTTPTTEQKGSAGQVSTLPPLPLSARVAGTAPHPPKRQPQTARYLYLAPRHESLREEGQQRRMQFDVRSRLQRMFRELRELDEKWESRRGKVSKLPPASSRKIAPQPPPKGKGTAKVGGNSSSGSKKGGDSLWKAPDP